MILKNVTANTVGTEIKLNDTLLLVHHTSGKPEFLNIHYINVHCKDTAELRASRFSQGA
jgi:hypothetical protein